MAGKPIDLTPYTTDAQPTAKDLEMIDDVLRRSNLLTKKFDDFVKKDHVKFALVRMYPDTHPFKKEDVYFWERILAHKALWKYLSEKIAAQWKLKASEMLQTIDYSVTIAREKCDDNEITHLVLDGNRLFDKEFPDRVVTLSEMKARLVSKLKKAKTPTKALKEYSGFKSVKGTRQAILELNYLVRGKLRAGRSLATGDVEGRGYRLTKSVRLKVI